MNKSNRFNSKYSIYQTLLEKEGNHLIDKEEIHLNILMITDVTDTKIKMSIADTMIIDPFKLL